MGWTTYSRWNSPKTREEERQEIVRLYTNLTEAAPFTAECLMASKVGSTWYVAILLTPKPGGAEDSPSFDGYVPDEQGRITYAGVVLTNRYRGEWGYKDMCENMGPTRAEAPAKLLKVLSPLDQKSQRYAQDWRDRVTAFHAARRAQTKISPGDQLEIETPFTFRMGDGTSFVSKRFEAFWQERAFRRARTLYRTLDTATPRVVLISRKDLQAAGVRVLSRENGAT